MKEKDKVGASVYIEDSPSNIETLRSAGKKIIIFSNSTNLKVEGPRASSWEEVEQLVAIQLEAWKAEKAEKHSTSIPTPQTKTRQPK
jgi:hypothetical protein